MTLNNIDKLIKKEYGCLNDYVKFFKLDGNNLYYFIGPSKKDFIVIYFNIKKLEGDDNYQLLSTLYYIY